MSTSNIVWIVIAALVVIALVAALAVLSSRTKRRRRVQQAGEIRDQAKLETPRVERREALAEETAARARAAQAEAEAKAAEAARLQDRAATHQSAAATSREQLDEQWQRAEGLDPKAERSETRDGDTREEARSQDRGGRDDTDHYRGAPT
jgi:uncharacterized protein HemX